MFPRPTKQAVFRHVGNGIVVAMSTVVKPPQAMECPECTLRVSPMPGSSWAIAWYSCGKCGTFWYARLRVGRDLPSEHTALPTPTPITPATAASSHGEWTLDELEAEANALRKESETLPKGDLEALRCHLEKLKVLADAINHRLDARALPLSQGAS